VTIRMAQSSQRLMILCRGKGNEPRIELSKNSIEFEPILPHSHGDEQEIKIVNPCGFPIEIYNLEFDKNYLDEEKVRFFISFFLASQNQLLNRLFFFSLEDTANNQRL
jgi:hydrocephalus-inducing protein